MKVLVFSALFPEKKRPYFGIFVKEEIMAMAKKYKNINFLVYSPGLYENYKSNILKNVVLVKKKNTKIFKRTLYFFHLIKYSMKFKPDIIHSNLANMGFVGGIVGKIFRIPSIVTVRGSDVHELSKIFSQRIFIYFSFLFNNRIITKSSDLKRKCIALGAKKEKIDVIYNGVDLKRFNPEKVKPVNLKGLTKNCKIIMNIGNLVEVKGQEHLVRAFKIVKGKVNNAKLLIIGDGGLKNHLNRIIKELNLENSVFLLGTVKHEKIPSYLALADVYVQPSLSEGVPNSVLEALAMEKPVVATNVGGIPEILNEEDAELVKPKDVSLLAESIIKRVTKKRRRKIKKYSWEETACKITKLYKSLSDLNEKKIG